MCGSNNMYTATVVFIHNEIMHTFLFIMYKNNGNRLENVLNRNHSVRVGEQELKPDDYPNVTNISRSQIEQISTFPDSARI